MSNLFLKGKVMAASINKSGLHLIRGPMWAGKSSMLISMGKKYQIIGKKVLYVNYKKDIRYGSGVVATHDQTSIPCISTINLLPIINDYQDAHVIMIDEGQFFADIVQFVEIAIERDNKIVIVAFLSGDFNRKNFNSILGLYPLAETITTLNALCRRCGDGTEAIFTKKLPGQSSEQEDIGGADKYEAVCRKHYS